MIKQIRLKNFKCFVDEPFELAPLTLFTGINGMGKSSVIQSLLLLKQSYANTYLQTQGKVSLFNRSFVDLENSESVCNNKADPKDVTIEFETDKGDIHKWIIDASVPDEIEPSFKYTGDGKYNNEALFSKDFIYLTAERLGPRKSYNVNPADKSFNTNLGIQGELTPIYIQKAISDNLEIGIEKLMHPSIKNEISNETQNPKELYRNLNAWLSEILGRPVNAKVSSIDKENVKLTFNLKGTQGGDYSALQVGFGFSFSLPVILAALIAKPGDLIIIENPEAHLHPAAQSKIGKLLALAAQNGVQVIVETHSDHLLNGIRVMVKGDPKWGKIDARNTQIHYFTSDIIDENDVKYKISFKIKENGEIERWPKGFFDEWDNNLDDLLS